MAVAQRPQFWLLPLAADTPLWISKQERRWSETLPPNLRQRYCMSRGQLRAQLAALLHQPALTVPLHSPPAQRPRLAEGHGYVSISHSRDQLLLAWSPWPIGVDLEWQQRPLQAEALAQRFFPEPEWQRLQLLAPPARRVAVLESWVCKEAAIKWQGSSLASDLRHWEWDRERQQLRHLKQGWSPRCRREQRDGWLCAVVGEAAEQGIWG